MLDLLKSAFHNLGRKRFRTLLTVLGVSIGVSSVIIIGNISQFGTEAVSAELDSLGLNGLSVSVLPEATNVQLGADDLEAVRTLCRRSNRPPRSLYKAQRFRQLVWLRRPLFGV